MKESQNSVPNGGFEAGSLGPEAKGLAPNGWATSSGSPQPLETVHESRPGSEGARCLKIHGDDRNRDGGVHSVLISLDPDRPLQVSAWVRGGGAVSAAVGLCFGVAWYDADRQPIPTPDGRNTTYLVEGYQENRWARVGQTFYPSARTSDERGQITRQEPYSPDRIPADAAFFEVGVFTVDYPRPAYADDILATQEIVPSDWVVGWEGPEDAKKGAQELARVASKVLGTDVVALPWQERPAKQTFVVTDARHAPPELAKRLEGKRRDAFLIQYPTKLKGREVCLLIANDEKACDFPVYHFLTRYMGVEWVGPDPLGEVLTLQPGWRIPERIDDLQNPDFEHRYWQAHGMNIRRWLAGSFRMQFHHNLGQVFDPVKHKDQPDLYPFYDGQRHVPDPEKNRFSGWQPCTGNPKAVEIAAQYGLDFLRDNPDKVSFSLSVNDGGVGSCMCDLCRAQDSPDAFDWGAANLSNRFFRFYNAVLEKTLEKNPNAYVAALGYGRAKIPPTGIRVHPRVLVFSVCDNSNVEPDYVERQKLWKASGATPCLYMWCWDGGFMSVRHYPHALRDAIRASYEMGGFGFYCEDITSWAAGAPKFYALARLLWDTKSDVDELMNRYMRLAFGEEAAPAVRAYFDRWEAVWEHGGKTYRYNTGREWRSAAHLNDLTREDLTAMDEALSRAGRAKATPEQKRRLEYVETYYRWLRVNADQYLVTRELSNEAWVSGRTPEEVMRETERGLGLTGAFDEMWKNVISADRTGWLLSARYFKDPQEPWTRLYEPIRREVLAAYDPAVDRAFDAITKDLLRSQSKGRVIAFWAGQGEAHPELAKWVRTQVHLLSRGPGANLLQNGSFERGDPGSPPAIPEWDPYSTGAGTTAEHAWSATEGRDGGGAAAVGRAWVGGLRRTIPTKEGGRYRVSGWYRTEWITESGLHHTLFWGVGGGRWPLSPTGGAWRQFSTTFTATSNGTGLNLISQGQKKGEWTWFDDVEAVEIGPAAPALDEKQAPAGRKSDSPHMGE
ncbi:MAG: hypothetical protein A3F84_26130 [Candidatus Handelsmanbacteria bacterium RIFCSPLOWO2_12_FULL_64_10]|uniref:CBM-cenC domain-containing protein n=1 Tax=Handelsmanbacteria sp. (strain RIFCSPLOWO2_12_FULL_64_10) TaxID=1817868 RepID=A0A1F6CAT8_HANXR|nr:MAG: hypothetical protein A3F84_26130 [Candidatus Handelsmanbacteria bacterium RIFCSPLOWO2_12_FULL_64_10]